MPRGTRERRGKNLEFTVRARLANAIRTRGRVDLLTWCERYRVLDVAASAEAGPWRHSKTPYLREIFEALDDNSPYRAIVFQKAAQLGGTEAALNWLGYLIHQHPAAVVVVQPTTEAVKRFSQQRFAALAAMEPLKGLVAQPRTQSVDAQGRQQVGTITTRSFRGGILFLVSALSASSLRSYPAKYAILDEVDGYPLDVGGEGDPVSLLLMRQVTFPRAKAFLISTPTLESTSRICAWYKKGDQRHYLVPCPRCGEYIELIWEQLKWEGEEAWYECQICGGRVEETEKPQMLQAGRWEKRAQSKTVASFKLNGLYSPWLDWGTMARDYTTAREQDAEGLLQSWTNTQLGEPWRGLEEEDIPAQQIAARREEYTPQDLPEEILMITAGVDVQDDRFEVEVVGWGIGDESWSIDYAVIRGRPDAAATWADLDKFLQRRYRTRDGRVMRVHTALVDTGGHFTQDVYRELKRRERNARMHILGVKGISPKSNPSQDIVIRIRKEQRQKTMVVQIDPDVAKTRLYRRLLAAKPGNGFCHFPKRYPLSFFEMLTSEKLVIRYIGGRKKREWSLKRRGLRNEALDCRVYAMAALELEKSHISMAALWDEVQRRREKHADTTTPAQKRPTRKKRRGWVKVADWLK